MLEPKQRIEAIQNLKGAKVVAHESHNDEDVEIDVTTDLLFALLRGDTSFEMTIAFGPEDPQDEYDVDFEFDTERVYLTWAEANLEAA